MYLKCKKYLQPEHWNKWPHLIVAEQFSPGNSWCLQIYFMLEETDLGEICPKTHSKPQTDVGLNLLSMRKPGHWPEFRMLSGVRLCQDKVLLGHQAVIISQDNVQMFSVSFQQELSSKEIVLCRIVPSWRQATTTKQGSWRGRGGLKAS